MALGRLTSALRLPLATISPIVAARAKLALPLRENHCQVLCLLVFLSSWWSNVEQGPPDAIFGLVDAYNKDKRSPKVNLTVGAYRDDQGKPLVLNVVKEVN